GGMYANRIHLVSSEKGVGVNLGDLNARQGDITLDASGKLALKSSLASGSLVAKGESVALKGENKASGALTVNVQTDITVDNAQLASDGDISLSGKGKITLGNATLTAGKDLNLAARDLTQGGNSRADAANNITASVAGKIDNQGQFVAGKNITLSSDTLANSGKLSAKGTARISANTLTNNGSVQSMGDQWLTAATLNNSGQWQSGGNISLSTQNMALSGLFSSSHNLNLNVADMLNVGAGGQLLSDGYLSATADTLLLSGVLNGHDGITLRSGQLASSDNSLLTSNGAVDIDTGSAQLGGKLFAQQDATLTSRGQFNTLAGSQLQSQQSLILNAQQANLAGTQAAKNTLQINNTGTLTHNGQGTGQTINVQSGTLTATGLLQATGNLSLNSDAIDQSGTLIAGQNLRIDGLSLNNRGTLQAADIAVALSGALDNQASGKLLAQRGVTLNASIVNNAGQLVADGALVLSTPQLTNFGLLQGQSLTVRGDSLDNRGQLLARDITLAQQNQIVNQADGRILAQDVLRLSAPALTNSGALAASDLELTTTTTTNSGTLQGDKRLALNADVLSNQAGAQILSGSGLTLTIPQLVNVGLIKAALDMTLNGTSLDNAGEITARRLTLSQRGDITNRQNGKLLAQDALALKGNRVSNSGVAAGDTLTLDAATVINSGRMQGSKALTLTAADLSSQGELLTDGALTAALLRLINTCIMQGQSLTVRGDSLDNRGQLLARDITLAQQNQIVNQADGRILAQDVLRLSAPALTNSGTLAASDLELTTTTTTNSGTLQGDNRLALNADVLSNQAGAQILSGSGLMLTIPQLVNVGLIKAALDMTLNGTSLDNAGEINARRLTLSQRGDITNRQNGKLLAQDALALKGNRVSNSGVAAGDTLTLDAATVINSGRMQGSMALALTAADLSSQGELLTDGALTAALLRLINTGIMQGQSLTVRGDSLDNRGQLLARDITLAQQNQIVNQADGRILAQEVLDLTTPLLVNDGVLATDRFTINSNYLINRGLLQGSTQLDLTVPNLDNQATGQIITDGSLTLDATSLNNSGLLQGDILTVHTGQWRNDGNTLGQNGVTATINGEMTGNGRLLSQQALQLTAKTLTNGGMMAADSITLNTDKLLNGGLIQGNHVLTVTKGNITNTLAGQFISGQGLNLTGDLLDNQGLLQGDILTVNAGEWSNSGNALGSHGVTGMVSGTLTSDGILLSQTDMRLQAKTLSNGGTLAANNLIISADILSNNGLLQGNSLLTLNTSQLSNLVGGQLISGGALALNLTKLINAGALQVNKLFTLNAANLDNSGTLQAQNINLILSGALTNQKNGKMLAQQALTAQTGTISNNGGVMAGDILDLTGDGIISSGLLQGNSSLTLGGSALSNLTEGQILTDGALNLNFGQLDNAGLLQGNSLSLISNRWSNSGRALALQSLNARINGDFNNTGLLLSQGSLQLNAQAFDNSGQLAADTVSLSGGSLDNRGTLQGNNGFILTNSSMTNRAGGQLISSSDMRLDAAEQSNSGLIIALALLTLNAENLDNHGTFQADSLQLKVNQQLTSQQDGRLLAKQALNFNGGKLVNDGQIAGDRLTLNVTNTTNQGLLQGAYLLALTGTGLNNLIGGRLLTDGVLDLTTTQLINGGTLQGQKVKVNSGVWNNTGSTLGTDTLDITVAGDLTNSGHLLSQGTTQVNSAQLTNTGALLSEGNVTLIGNKLVNRGSIQGGNLNVGNGQVDNSGTLIGLQSLTLQAAQNLQARLLMTQPLQVLTNNNGGSLLTQGILNINGGDITNNGSWQGQQILLTANKLQNNGAIQSADGMNLTLSGDLLSAANSKITANGSAALQALGLTNNGQWIAKNLTLRGNTFNNSGETSGVNGLTLSLNGAFNQQQGKTLLTGGTLALNAASVTNLGRIQGGDTQITSGTLDNQGRIQGDNGLRLTLTGNLTNSAAGSILSQKGLIVTTPNLINYGVLQGGTSSRIDAANSTRNDGKLLFGSDLTLNTAGLTNNGWMQATTLLLNATSASNNGTLLADQQATLTGNTLNNQSTIQAANLTSNYQGLTNSGTLLGNNQLTITANQVTHQAAGKLFSGGNLLLNSAGFDQIGQVVALGNLTVGLTNAFTTRNVMAAGNILTLSSNGNITNQSVMQGQGLNIRAGGVLTNNGQLTAGTAASNLSGSRIAMNAAGTLQSGGDIALTSASDIVFNGFTGTRGSLTASATGTLLNTALLYAGNNMSLLANSIRNQRGDILAGNSLWMQRDAAGNANTEVVNTSGAIETQNGDITIKTGHLLNERDGLNVSSWNETSTLVSGVGDDTLSIYVRDLPTTAYSLEQWTTRGYRNCTCAIEYDIYHTMYKPTSEAMTQTFADVTNHLEVTATGGAARISSGRNLLVNAGALENQASFILSANDTVLSGNQLNNASYQSGTTANYYQYIYESSTGGQTSEDGYKLPLSYSSFVYRLTGRTSESVLGELYRAVIQAGGNVVANFTNNISNTTTTANAGGVSTTISAPSLNTLSNQNISGGVQKQNLASADKVTVGSPQWQDQLQNALQQINGGGSLASLNTAQGNTISLNGGQVGLNQYGASGGTVDINGNAVGMNDYSTHGGNGVNLSGQGSSLNNYAAASGNTSSLSGNSASLNGYKASTGNAETVNIRAVDLSAYPLPTSNNGYFVAVSDPKSPYLIATNPKLDGLGQLDPSLFGDLYDLMGVKPGSAPRETNSAYTDQNKFLGSSYFLDRLNLKPEYDYRFLGDAAFDTRYVSNAMLNQTGNRYLNGVGSDLEQMQYLMDNAARAQQSLGLNFGVALTADQIAALDHSILWWEATVINGETVLVPKLYLSPKDVTVNNGSVIAGNNVTLNGGNITNSGSTLSANNNLSINSDNSISNLNAGLISAGGGLQLSALGDINNIGSTISGKTVALESINGSINNITLADTWSLAAPGK
ncbi:beta strand repeat-containing protein, partial [Dryocola boscaweniae]